MTGRRLWHNVIHVNRKYHKWCWYHRWTKVAQTWVRHLTRYKGALCRRHIHWWRPNIHQNVTYHIPSAPHALKAQLIHWWRPNIHQNVTYHIPSASHTLKAQLIHWWRPNIHQNVTYHIPSASHTLKAQLIRSLTQTLVVYYLNVKLFLRCTKLTGPSLNFGWLTTH